MFKSEISKEDFVTPPRYQNETSNTQTIKRKHPEHTTHTDEKCSNPKYPKKISLRHRVHI
uniref:Ovule protein n=2 Tax=Loa loa TaxID=7209 RepID=A0A1I7VE69_LOALO